MSSFYNNTNTINLVSLPVEFWYKICISIIVNLTESPKTSNLKE